MSANDKQIGGTHYQSGFQTWDLDRVGLGYYEITAIKYIVRWRKKNGLEDVEKALHYIEKLAEEARYQGRQNRALLINAGWTLGVVTLQFLDKNGITDPHERAAIDRLITWRTREQVEEAQDACLVLKSRLLEEADKAPDTERSEADYFPSRN